MPEPASRRPAPGYGRVRLRKQGRYWYARYTLPSGERVSPSLHVTNKEVAEQKAREINEMLERGEVRSSADLAANKARTFSDLAAIFLESYPRWSKRTKSSQASTVRQLTRRLGERPLATITTRDLTEYLSERKREGLKETSSYNRYRSVLSSMFKFAISQGW
ncbi:MAG: site-specific integrase, partial [Gemmatimonadota bacterium]